MAILHFVYLFITRGHLGFHFSVIMNNGALNVLLKTYVDICLVLWSGIALSSV